MDKDLSIKVVRLYVDTNVKPDYSFGTMAIEVEYKNEIQTYTDNVRLDEKKLKRVLSILERRVQMRKPVKIGKWGDILGEK